MGQAECRLQIADATSYLFVRKANFPRDTLFNLRLHRRAAAIRRIDNRGACGMRFLRLEFYGLFINAHKLIIISRGIPALLIDKAPTAAKSRERHLGL